MKVVIVGPVPGIAPNSVPTSVPRTIGAERLLELRLRRAHVAQPHLACRCRSTVMRLTLTQEVGDAEQAHRERHQLDAVARAPAGRT